MEKFTARCTNENKKKSISLKVMTEWQKQINLSIATNYQL